MKKIILMMMGLLASTMMMKAADSKMYIDTVTIVLGHDTIVDINLDNPTAKYVGMQCDLYLPAGITMQYDEDEYEGYAVIKTKRLANNHVLAANLSEGRYIILIYSPTNAYFKGTSGALFQTVLHADESLAPGTYTGYIRNLILGYITAESDDTAEIPFVIKVVDKSTATGIKEMTASKPANETEKIYDLQGREVSNMLPGNLYIVNGKKVVK